MDRAGGALIPEENVMAPELETWSDGSALFVSARSHAWHRLGECCRPGSTPRRRCGTRSCGWNVRKEPLQTAPLLSEHGVTTLPVPEQFATVRTLGVVGRGYTPIQNEAHADLLDAVVDEPSHFETAESLRGGRQVYITMKLPTTMRIGGVDPVELYLVAVNSHDGTSAFRLPVSPVRVVCANTQARTRPVRPATRPPVPDEAAAVQTMLTLGVNATVIGRPTRPAGAASASPPPARPRPRPRSRLQHRPSEVGRRRSPRRPKMICDHAQLSVPDVVAGSGCRSIGPELTSGMFCRFNVSGPRD
jgi:hypothetical protein